MSTAVSPDSSLSAPSQSRLKVARFGLVAVQFLMWGGFFSLAPLITVRFVSELHWAAASIGLILGVRQLSQQGLTIFVGPYSDAIGPKPLILVGCLLRLVGFLVIGWAGSFPVLLLGSLLAGVGGALFDSPRNAAMASVTPPEERSRAFTLMNMGGSAGMVVGPLVGSLLIGYGFQTAALAAASVYLIAALIIALTLPNLAVSKATSNPKHNAIQQGFEGLKKAATDLQFRRFTLVLIGYYVMSTQLNVLVALKVVELANKKSVGVMYAVSAGLAVALQFWLVPFLEKRVSKRANLVGAAVVVGTALGLMAFVPNFAWLLVCVALYSVGNMTVFPAQQTLIARMAPAALVGSYYGFSSISLGAGGAIGNFLGGALLDLGKKIGFTDLPWLVLFVTGMLTAFGLHWALKNLPQQEAENNVS